MAYNWTCPYCAKPQTATAANMDSGYYEVSVGRNAEGKMSVGWYAYGCVNLECRRTSVTMMVGRAKLNQTGSYVGYDHSAAPHFSQRVLPNGSAKPQPEFLPRPIVEDYYEACLIKDLSPKASATLIRRCLQGMIRDFTGIKRNRLVDEIDELRKSVSDGSADRSITPETVEAIDHVRSIGNIGAHMEKNIDHIVEVDPEEAQILIELVEMLFDEWYIAREARRSRLARIESVAADKLNKKRGADATAADPN